MTNFDRARITELLLALDRALARRGATADIYLFGGAAMALTFDANRSTRDLDAVFAPTSEVRSAAAEVASDWGIQDDWLNDAAKGYVPPSVDPDQQVLHESDHLRVCVASAAHLLAMKVAASRVEQDRGDLELLLSSLGITSADAAISVARECLGPSYPIPPKAQYLLEEILGQ